MKVNKIHDEQFEYHYVSPTMKYHILKVNQWSEFCV